MNFEDVLSILKKAMYSLGIKCVGMECFEILFKVLVNMHRHYRLVLHRFMFAKMPAVSDHQPALQPARPGVNVATPVPPTISAEVLQLAGFPFHCFFVLSQLLTDESAD